MAEYKNVNRIWAWGVALIVAAAMSALAINIALHDSLGHGAGMDTFQRGLADPWQAFINFDLMAGLLIMVTWIIWRESGGHPLTIFAWAWLVLWWGNISVAVYLLWALHRTRGDWPTFFMGKHALTPRWNGASVLPAPLRVLATIVAASALFLLIRGLTTPNPAPLAAFGYINAYGSIALGALVAAFSIPRPQPAKDDHPAPRA